MDCDSQSIHLSLSSCPLRPTNPSMRSTCFRHQTQPLLLFPTPKLLRIQKKKTDIFCVCEPALLAIQKQPLPLHLTSFGKTPQIRKQSLHHICAIRSQLRHVNAHLLLLLLWLLRVQIRLLFWLRHRCVTSRNRPMHLRHLRGLPLQWR